MPHPLILYLDQKDWVHLDLAVRGRPRSSEEAAAAAALVAAIDGEKVALPLSSAHVDELDKQTSDIRRRLLGATMWQLSHSWKMVSPLIVRQDEMAITMRELVDHHAHSEPLQVFTNAPGPQYLGTYTPYEASPEFPEELRALISAEVGEEAHRALLLEKSRDAAQDREAYAAKERWAAGIQRLANYLKTNPRRAGKLELVAAGWLLSDLGDELARAATRASVPLEDFQLLVARDPIALFDGKPFLSVLFRLYEQRLRNPNDPWKPNDLNDMHFLGLAAAYADAVVGEKHFIKLLADIRPKAQVRARLCANLPECIAGFGPKAAGPFAAPSQR